MEDLKRWLELTAEIIKKIGLEVSGGAVTTTGYVLNTSLSLFNTMLWRNGFMLAEGSTTLNIRILKPEVAFKDMVEMYNIPQNGLVLGLDRSAELVVTPVDQNILVIAEHGKTHMLNTIITSAILNSNSTFIYIKQTDKQAPFGLSNTDIYDYSNIGEQLTNICGNTLGRVFVIFDDFTDLDLFNYLDLDMSNVTYVIATKAPDVAMLDSFPIKIIGAGNYDWIGCENTEMLPPCGFYYMDAYQTKYFQMAHLDYATFLMLTS